MAKKHVALRYAQIENEYLEMQSLLKELNDRLSNLCKENSIQYIDVYNNLIDSEGKTLLPIALQSIYSITVLPAPMQP